MTLRMDRASGHPRLVDCLGLLVGIVVLSGLMPRLAAGQASPTLTGTVVERGTERLIVGADVRLRAVKSPAIIARTTTDRSGLFQLEDLLEGTYALEVERLGYETARRTLTLELAESRDVTVPLSRDVAGVESVVEAPTRGPTSFFEGASSVSVVTPEVIQKEGMSSTVDALRPTAGVHVAQIGIDRRMLSLRGIGRPFSGTPEVRIDERPAGLPLLGTSTVGPMPTLSHDLRRIEVVRGPATPLYGPVAGGGLLRFDTRDPLQKPGTSVALTGGTQRFVDAQVRQAGEIGGTVGYKLTGQFSRADEWRLDPDHPADAAEIARYRTYAPDEEIPTGRPTVGRQLRRETFYRTFNGNGLLTYRIDDETRLSVRSGFASLTSPLQTGLGTIQANELSYGYTQLGIDAGAFSARAGLQRNLWIGEAYRLETGDVVLDEGTRWTGQARYGWTVDAWNTRLLAGGDLDVTALDASASPSPSDDGVGAYGGYLQSITDVSPALTLTLTGRVHYNDGAEATALLPSAALNYTLSPPHALYTRYTRSTSYPGTDPLFAAGRFDVSPDLQTTTQTVELGYKGRVLDRVRVHLEGYAETQRNVLTSRRADGDLSYAVVDQIGYGGLDAAVRVRPMDRASVFVNTSIVTDNQFSGSSGETPPVALNAPATTIKGGVDYTLPAGVSVGTTAQYVDDFPVRWGPYVGRVDAYTLLDVRVGYSVPSVPGLRVDLAAKNVLGSDHREFVGAPAVERRGMVRFTYNIR